MLQVLLASAVLCLSSLTEADKSFPSQGLSHVVRVGRNGRQVIHRGQGGRQGGSRGRKVVRRKERKERQFIPAAPVTFALPPAPAPALRLAPTPAVPLHHPHHAVRVANPAVPLHQAHHAVRVAAPVPAFTPTLFNPFAPVRAAPLHTAHSIPAPVPFVAAPLPIAPPPAPAPFIPAPPAPVAPAPAVIVEAREIPLEYGAPSTVAPEVRTNYLAPAQDYLPAVEEVVEVEVARQAPSDYLPAVEEIVQAPSDYLPAVEEIVQAPSSYLPAVEEVKEAPVDYLPAVEEVKQAPAEYLPAVEEVKQAPAEYLPAVEEAPRAYLSPVEANTVYLSPAPAPVQEVVEVEVAREAPANTYIAVPEPAYVPNVAANRKVTAAPAQIGIVRNILNSPSANPEFNYDFEGANQIKQEAEGTMRRVEDTDVVVMRGSYEYIGTDNELYRVDWYADETGFHPTASHIPLPVVPNHPEVAAAVRAQIAFAKEEDAAKARASSASSTNSYLAPEELPGYGY